MVKNMLLVGTITSDCRLSISLLLSISACHDSLGTSEIHGGGKSTKCDMQGAPVTMMGSGEICDDLKGSLRWYHCGRRNQQSGGTLSIVVQWLLFYVKLQRIGFAGVTSIPRRSRSTKSDVPGGIYVTCMYNYMHMIIISTGFIDLTSLALTYVN